ncbi:MAG TPA: hypothetical protein VGS06_14625 [Streptosporangiaceae bacterium]|nr:hypothetical protein [Streptosporangiaceae bacterium]
MLAIIIAAVLGAAVGAFTTASLKWGRSALAIVRAHLRRDHRTLYGGRAWALPQSVSAGAPCSARVLVACAPSRAIRQSGIDPDRAIPFIRESFPGMFPDEPSMSLPQEGIKFTVASQGSPSDGYAWAWASGRVDLAIDIQLDCGPDQRFSIPLLDVLRPIAMMAAAVSGPSYAKVYGKTRTRLPRRFDWFIAISMDYVHPGALTIEWDDVTFPGRRPPRAGSGQRTFCPVGGYAAAKLKNWKAGSSVAELLAVFLEDFLKQNGYHDSASAITDAVAAAVVHAVDGNAPNAPELPEAQETESLTPAS